MLALLCSLVQTMSNVNKSEDSLQLVQSEHALLVPPSS